MKNVVFCNFLSLRMFSFFFFFIEDVFKVHVVTSVHTALPLISGILHECVYTFQSIVNNAALNIVYKFFCGHVFISLEYIHRSMLVSYAGSYDNSIFNILKNCLNVFQSDCYTRDLRTTLPCSYKIFQQKEHCYQVGQIISQLEQEKSLYIVLCR